MNQLTGRTLDVLEVSRPQDTHYAIHLAKVVSKLSPLIGNMIEFYSVKHLNDSFDWEGLGKWIRQDPGFPDAVFQGSINPRPGIEIKTWFPLATEITARFKDSILNVSNNNINVAMIAWLPENLIFGKPKVVGVWIDSAKSLAIARDKHYHNPPDYLVFEPEDTSSRTSNLQQTNTNGYKFQGTAKQFTEAQTIVASWGPEGKKFSEAKEYQERLKGLLGKYTYRLDTNFAKMDRIEHESLEIFKSQILKTTVNGKTIAEWSKLITSDEKTIEELIKEII